MIYHKDLTGSDLHIPKTHKSSHEAGGSDEINTVNITGGTITGITDLLVADGGTGSSTASGARTNLGLVIGTDVQAYDAGLLSIAGLTTAADKMIYTTALDTYAVASLTAFARSILDTVFAGSQIPNHPISVAQTRAHVTPSSHLVLDERGEQASGAVWWDDSLSLSRRKGTRHINGCDTKDSGTSIRVSIGGL